MAVASLVLGIVSLIIGFIPFCGSIALLPAIIGFILGIVSIVLNKKKGDKIGMGVAGLVLSIIATIVIIFWVFIAVGLGIVESQNSRTYTIRSNSSSYYNKLK